MEKSNSVRGNRRKMELQTRMKTGNNLKWHWIILSIAAILIILGIVLVTFFMREKPKELFFKAEANSLQQALEEWEDLHGDLLTFQKLFSESPSENDVKIDGKVEIDSAGIHIEEMLKDISLDFKTKMIPDKSAVYQKADLRLNDVPLIKGELVQTDEISAIKIPALYNDYLYVKNNEYGDLIRRFDPDYKGPDQLEVQPFRLADYVLADDDKTYLKERYKEFLLTQLSDDHFDIEKRVKYQHDDVELSLTKVTLELTENETKEFFEKLINLLEKDDRLHDMVATRYVKFMKSSGSGFKGTIADITYDEDEMKNKIKQKLRDVKQKLKEIRIKDGLTYTVFIDKNDLVIDRNISLGIEGSEQLRFEISVKNVPLNNREVHKETKFEIKPYGDQDKKHKFSAEFVHTTSKKEKEITGDTDFSIHIQSKNQETISTDLTVHSTYKEENQHEQKIIYDVTLEVDESNQPPFKITGTLAEDRNINLEEKKLKQRYDGKFDYDGAETGPFSLHINMDSNTKLVDQEKAKFPDAEDGINVNALNDEELYELLTDLEENFYRYLTRISYSLYEF